MRVGVLGESPAVRPTAWALRRLGHRVVRARAQSGLRARPPHPHVLDGVRVVVLPDDVPSPALCPDPRVLLAHVRSLFAHGTGDVALVLAGVVPVGTHELVRQVTSEADAAIHVVSAPPRLQPTTRRGTPEPAVVLGTRDGSRVHGAMAALFAGRALIQWTDPESAEFAFERELEPRTALPA